MLGLQIWLYSGNPNLLNCKHPNPTKKGNWGVFSSILILVVPKCPFCFAGYTSAITICGIRPESHNSWELYLVGFLILVILASILLKNRGMRTAISLAVVLLGSIVLIYGALNTNMTGYYFGSVLLLVGSLINRKIFVSMPRIFS